MNSENWQDPWSEVPEELRAELETELSPPLMNPHDCIFRFENGRLCHGKRDDVIHNEKGHSIGYHPFFPARNAHVALFNAQPGRAKT